MNRFLRWPYIVTAIVLLFLLYVWTGFNSLVSQREAVTTAWAQVQAQEQRRFDLVPNLMRTVQGSASFEQSTLVAVTQARTSWQNASTQDQQVAAAQNFEGALSRLLVTVEAYPDIKSTQAFQDFMTELEGTENRISVARQDYNDAVQVYNVQVKRFPTNLFAGMFGFAPESFFQVSTPAAEQAPTVDFGSSSSR